jgi:hypothetical protein
MSSAPSAPVSPAPETCSRCQRALQGDDRVQAGGKTFCRSCYETLRQQLEQAVQGMSTDIRYPAAALGAVLGGVVGALIWWGFTVVTHFAFGLVAVAIGFLVGQGAVVFSGGKRSRGLQVLAVVTSLVSFVVATYLVNMTFLSQAYAKLGQTSRITFPPTSGDMLVTVLSASFGIMDVVFLAITLWQAWKIPAPLKLPKTEAA